MFCSTRNRSRDLLMFFRFLWRPNAADLIILTYFFIGNSSIFEIKIIESSTIHSLIIRPVILPAEVSKHIFISVYDLQFSDGRKSPSITFTCTGTLCHIPRHTGCFITSANVYFCTGNFKSVFGCVWIPLFRIAILGKSLRYQT